MIFYQDIFVSQIFILELFYPNILLSVHFFVHTFFICTYFGLTDFCLGIILFLYFSVCVFLCLHIFLFSLFLFQFFVSMFCFLCNFHIHFIYVFLLIFHWCIFSSSLFTEGSCRIFIWVAKLPGVPRYPIQNKKSRPIWPTIFSKRPKLSKEKIKSKEKTFCQS